MIKKKEQVVRESLEKISYDEMVAKTMDLRRRHNMDGGLTEKMVRTLPQDILIDCYMQIASAYCEI